MLQPVPVVTVKRKQRDPAGRCSPPPRATGCVRAQGMDAATTALAISHCEVRATHLARLAY